MLANSKDRKTRELLQKRTITGQRTRELFLAQAIRNDNVFDRFRDLLKPEHLRSYSASHAIIWQVVLQLHTKHGKLSPLSELLKADIEELMEVNPELLTVPESEDVDAFLNFAYDPQTFPQGISSDIYTEWAINAGKRFLQEQIAAQAQEYLTVKDEQVSAKMPALMDNFSAELARIEAVSSASVEECFPEAWETTNPLPLFPTGIDFIDTRLGGGHSPGEVYGLMGPYGTCKSTLVYMLAVLGARYFDMLHRQGKATGPPALSFIVSYEESLPEMRRRTLGFAAKIPRARLENMASMAQDLSRREQPETWLDYERKLFANDIARNQFDAEYERAQTAIAFMNRHMAFIDMTGRTTRGVGGGGIPEIAQRVMYECRRRKARCGLMLVDHVSELMERFIAASNLSPDYKRHVASSIPSAANNQLADAFECPVWLVQQLSGSANDYPPWKLASHTDAAEAKDFAKALDFCFSSGTKFPDNTALFNATKTRRQAGGPPSIVRIEGSLNRVVCCDGELVMMPGARQPITVADARTQAGGDTVSNEAEMKARAAAAVHGVI